MVWDGMLRELRPAFSPSSTSSVEAKNSEFFAKREDDEHYKRIEVYYRRRSVLVQSPGSAGHFKPAVFAVIWGVRSRGLVRTEFPIIQFRGRQVWSCAELYR